MKLVPISGAERLPFYFACVECGARVKSSAEHSADLDGPPFASFRCARCTRNARVRLSREIVGDTPEGAGWYVAVARDGGGWGSVAFFGKHSEAQAEVARRKLRNLSPSWVETAARADGGGAA